jgi:pyrimidine operon attenuation protein / uracil phosphoribosyltransferase
MDKKRLLDQKQTLQKIKRMAFEIYEQNFEESEIILAGITGQGVLLMELLVEELKAIAPFKISTATLEMDKKSETQPEIHINSDVDTFKNKVIILVDDVLHTGRTVAYVLRPFLSIPLKKLQVAVMVDRGHQKYPIAATYIGYHLSTTLTEHIQVVLNDQKLLGVYVY